MSSSRTQVDFAPFWYARARYIVSRAKEFTFNDVDSEGVVWAQSPPTGCPNMGCKSCSQCLKARRYRAAWKSHCNILIARDFAVYAPAFVQEYYALKDADDYFPSVQERIVEVESRMEITAAATLLLAMKRSTGTVECTTQAGPFEFGSEEEKSNDEGEAPSPPAYAYVESPEIPSVSSAESEGAPAPGDFEFIAELFGTALRSTEMARIMRGLDGRAKKMLLDTESFGLFALQLYRCKSTVEYITTVYTFIQLKYGISVLSSGYEWVQKIIQDNGPDEVMVQSGNFGDILRGVANAATAVKYSAFTHNFRKVGILLSTLCVCKAVGAEATPSKFNEIWKSISEQAVIADVITQLLEGLLWIYERCLPIITGEKKVASVFTGAKLANHIDIRYAELLHAYNAVQDEGAVFDVAQCERSLAELYQMEEDMVKIMTQTGQKLERTQWLRQLTSVKGLKDGYCLLLQGSALRMSPFAVLVSGNSATGKSCASALVIPVLQRALGVLTGPKYVYNSDPQDKYMSGLKPTANTFVYDDIANIHPNFVEQSPAIAIIETINNNPRYARMADVDSKGKMPIRPAVLVGTTNIADLDATVYTRCPLSVLRRFKVHMKVKVKPEFCLPGTGMLDPSVRPQDHAYDVWTVQLREAITGDSSAADKHNAAWRTLSDADGEMHSVSMARALRYMASAARQHKQQQENLVWEANSLHTRESCEHGVMSSMCDLCVPVAVEPPVGVQAGEFDAMWQELAHFNWHVSQLTTTSVSVRGAYTMARHFGGALMQLPMRFRRWETMVRVAMIARSARPIEWVKRASATGAVVAAYSYQQAVTPSLLGSACFGIVVTLAILAVCAYLYVLRHLDNVFCGIKHRPLALPRYPLGLAVENAGREDYFRHFPSAAAIVAALSIVLLAYRSMRMVQTHSQGSRYSLPIPEDAQKAIDPWRRAHVVPVPRNMDRLTSTGKQMADVLSQKLCVLSVYDDLQGGTRALCWPVQTNFWLAPFHVLEKDFKYLSIQCDGTDRLHYRHKLVRAGSYQRIGKSDLALIYVPGKGDQADLVQMFPAESDLHGDKLRLKNTPCRIAWAKLTHKMEDGRTWLDLERNVIGVNAKSREVTPTDLPFSYWGGDYQFLPTTFEGLCGAPIVKEGPGPFVVGCHSAGKTGDQDARFCTVTREEVRATISYMTRVDSAMCQGAAMADWPQALNFDTMKFSNTKIEHSALDWVEGELELLGSHNGQARTLRSDVVTTPISDLVLEKFGVPNTHGKPAYIGHWYPWQLFLKTAGDPWTVPQPLIDMAFRDYTTKVFGVLEENPEWKRFVNPLNDDANLAGADGVKGCYAVNLNASMGIPWCKPKRDYLLPSDRSVEGISRPLDMPEDIRESINAKEEKLANGERIYAPHRANLKDEPTTLGKEKVRVFSGVNFEYLFLMRRYFLPILIFMHNRSDLFETAVGVNHVSTEWNALRETVTRHGETNCIAGDYSEYDKRMMAAFVLAAFKVMIQIAIWAGYSPRQIAIMRSLATETSSPVYEMMLEWVRVHCTNPSGHPGTVDVNGIVNCLMYRAGYYALKPENEERLFHQLASLMTYGDDSVVGVSGEAPWFNHSALQGVFASWGVGYTMADKTSESVPYIHIDDVSFLKRKWVWSTEHNRYMAPLEEKSIFKMLHNVVKSKSISIDEQVAECISAANREFFQYGKTRFEATRKLLTEIAEEHGVTHYFAQNRLRLYDELVTWMEECE